MSLILNIGLYVQQINTVEIKSPMYIEVLLNPERWKYYDDEFSTSGHESKVLKRGVCILADYIYLSIVLPSLISYTGFTNIKPLSVNLFGFVCLSLICSGHIL